MPSTYISAEWIEDPVMGTRTIKAIGDDDSVWWIPAINCDVPPWPDFLKSDAGKAFVASAEATPAKAKK